MERRGLAQSCDGRVRHAMPQLRHAEFHVSFHVRFPNDSPIWLAVFGILAVFLAVWAMLTARDPKRWRQWWMAMLGLTDMNTTREQRRRKEFYLSIAGYVAFSLLLGASAISAYCVIVNVREQRDPRSDFEQAKDKTILDFKKMRTDKQFRKL